MLLQCHLEERRLQPKCLKRIPVNLALLKLEFVTSIVILLSSNHKYRYCEKSFVHKMTFNGD